MAEDKKELEESKENTVEKINEIESLTESAEEPKYKNRRKVIQIIIIAVILGLAIWLTIYFVPLFIELKKDQAAFDEFIARIRGYGFGGAILLVAVCVLQVVLAFIPGEIVELAAGVMYGPFMGFIIIEIGVTLGCIIVYYLVKLLGSGFVKSVVDVKASKRFKLLGDARRTEVIIFGILLVPGIPKDFIAFLIPMTKVKLHRFLIINAIARIPSIISSTFLGDSVIAGNYTLTIVITAISLVIGVLCVVFNKQMVEIINKMGKKKRKEA